MVLVWNSLLENLRPYSWQFPIAWIPLASCTVPCLGCLWALHRRNRKSCIITYKSSISLKVVGEVPNMQCGRVVSGPSFHNKPFKTGSSSNSTHVSINQELRRPILQRTINCGNKFLSPSLSSTNLIKFPSQIRLVKLSSPLTTF